MIVLALTGYETVTIKGIFYRLLFPFVGVNRGFVASFIVFYAFVPIYNKLIGALSKKELLMTICGLLAVFTLSSTFFLAGTMNEPFWYMTLYLIAAYIRLYPNKYITSIKLSGVALFITVGLSILSVLCVSYYFDGVKIPNLAVSYFFVSDSNKLFAFLVGLSSFLLFKNMEPRYSRIINFLASGTFAVLLIHASSDAMRHWLWRDIVDVPSALSMQLVPLIIYSIIIPIVVFLLCTSFDFLRREYFEKRLFK